MANVSEKVAGHLEAIPKHTLAENEAAGKFEAESVSPVYCGCDVDGKIHSAKVA